MRPLAGTPHVAEVVERLEEARGIFTLRLRFTEPEVHAAYGFAPGQFNMLYLHGVGGVPISIVSDPEDEHMYDHTIRAVGRVTRALAGLKAGDRIGVRGPFGRSWPLKEAEGRDVVIATGGLGCAPVVSVINYVLRRRERYGRLVILQGVKHTADLIWRERYERWARMPDTQVLLAASQSGPQWPWRTGNVLNLFDEAHVDPDNSVVMMCGPEGMMIAVVEELKRRGLPEYALWLSMERNMQCGSGRCGHCQHGGRFVCRDGPVFNYPDVKELLGVRGF
ncbi:MAG TPA: FAD/NAD(P)-binding protein [Gammaproteobacteria bacterium]|nr:FAD/NAD(P)-binding protein [Gammaproteobacteria bacterium]